MSTRKTAEAEMFQWSERLWMKLAKPGQKEALRPIKHLTSREAVVYLGFNKGDQIFSGY